MVPNLPYFMVHWDYRGEKGYGHVIEAADEAAGGTEEAGFYDVEDSKGGKFPRYFATETLGGMLELAPNAWRKPRRCDPKLSASRIAAFKARGWSKHDWTPMLRATDGEQEVARAE